MDQDIALCISGQMRTYRKCYGFLMENIINPLEPDIFIHTWREQGGTTKADIDVADYYDPVTEQRLDRLYSPIAAHVEDFDDEYFTQKDGVAIPKKLKEETNHWKGNIPLFYKMYACNELKSRHENRNGFEYDIVIKIRPDLIVSEPIPEKVFNEPNTLWHSEYGIDTTMQVSDKFAISSSENIDYYTSVWEHLNDYWENPLGDGMSKNIRVGERLMRHHLEKKNINVDSFSSHCKILRTRQYAIEQNRTTIADVINSIRNKLP